MKKFFVFILASVTILSVSGCGDTQKKNGMSSSTAESSVESSGPDEVSDGEPEEASKQEPSESSEEVSQPTSKEVEKTLKVYESFSKKYHGADLWDSIKCYGRFKKDSGDGYYKKDDLVRIIGKYEDDSKVIIYTDSGGVNFEKSDIIEFLPKSYSVSENDRLINTPTLPASKVLEDTYVGAYKDNYNLPCFSPKEKYSEDYGNSLDVVYDKKMIVRYGKLLRDMIVYSDDSNAVKKTNIHAGSYVGLMSYSYGEGFGMFGVYNNGKSYTIPEYIHDNPKNKYIEVMPEDFKLPKNSEVYGLDEKTKILSHAAVEPVKPASDTAIKTVTPINPVYFSFTDSKNTVYNLIKGDKLSVVSEDGDVYTCLYEDICFRISKFMVRDYEDEKSRASG